MWPVTAEFLATLRQSHVVTLQIDAYRGAELVYENVPITGGSITVDESSMIRRTVDLTIGDPALNPGTDPAAALTPYAAELAIRRGIRYPNGKTEWAPVGRFRVNTANASAVGDLQVTGADRSAYLQDARFIGLTTSDTSLTIPEQIRRLILEVLPTVEVRDLTGSTARTPAVTWEEDRLKAIDDLATAIGAEVYFDPEGNAVIAPPAAIDDPPVWILDAGASGVLVNVTAETTREGTYNGVFASGEPGDGDPVWSTVVDTDPSSPTYWEGPFGKKPYVYTSPLITTVTQARDAATSLLAKVRGMSRQVSVELIPNPALEAGDVIHVIFPDGTVERHLIKSIGLPLDPGSAMSIGTKTPEPEG